VNKPFFVAAFALVVLIAQPAAPAGVPGGTSKGSVQTTAVKTVSEVANDFLQALANAEIDKLVTLGADPFDFDGELMRGRNEIEASWKRFMKRNHDSLEMLVSGEINVIGYPEALKRFGKAPKKFSHLPLGRCKFAVVTFAKRNGLMLILAPLKPHSWQVVAATD
jgi:hypothetical protein